MLDLLLVPVPFLLAHLVVPLQPLLPSLTVDSGIPTNSKLATMNVGFGPDTLAKIVKWNTVRVNGKDSSHHIEYVPVYMSCKGCGDAISSTEANLADVLSSLCFKCFANITDQEYSWHGRR